MIDVVLQQQRLVRDAMCDLLMVKSTATTSTNMVMLPAKGGWQSVENGSVNRSELWTLEGYIVVCLRVILR